MADLPNPNPGVSTEDFNAAQSVHFQFMEINTNLLAEIEANIENSNNNFLSWADDWNKESLDAKRARMEAALEAKKGINLSSDTKKVDKKIELPKMSMGILGFGAIAGLVASVTGLDDVINAAKLPGRITMMSTALTKVGTFLGTFGTLLKDTFKLPKNLSTTMTAELIGDWFKEATKKIKSVLKFDTPGFIKFADDVKLSGTSMLDDLTKGVANVKSTLKNLIPKGLLTLADNAKVSGTSMLDDLTKGVANVKSTFKTMMGPVINFGKNVKSGGATMVDDVTKGIANVKTSFKAAGDIASDSLTKGLTGAKTTIANIKTFFANIFAPLGDLKAAISLDVGADGPIKKAITSIGDFFKPLKTFFSGIMDVIKVPLKIVGTMAKTIPVVGQVIGLVMGIFDFFTGFIDAFSDQVTYDEDGNEMKDSRSIMQKTIDGVQGGLLEFFRGFITLPLDMIKDGVSWVMAKLGFPGAEKAMDSFSFTAAFDKFFEKGTSFEDIIRKLVTLPAQGVKWIWATLLGFLGFKDAEKWMKGFSFEDLIKEAGIGIDGEFSFGTVLKTFITSIVEWFDDLFDIDFGAIVEKMIPEGLMGDAFRKLTGLESPKQINEENAKLDAEIVKLQAKYDKAFFEKDQTSNPFAGRKFTGADSKEDIEAQMKEAESKRVRVDKRLPQNASAIRNRDTFENYQAGTKLTPEQMEVYARSMGSDANKERLKRDVNEVNNYEVLKEQYDKQIVEERPERLAALGKTTKGAANALEVAVGSAANAGAAGTMILATPPAGGAAASSASPDSTTNNVSSSTTNHVSKVQLIDRVRPEQAHMRRFAAGAT